MTRFSKRMLICLLAVLCSGAWAQEEETEHSNALFRYKNDRGHLVVDQSIPPAAAARGYEIITDTGRVLKEVPPAPKGEDAVRYAEQLRREAELAEWDARLKRRFSSVKDIESAKKRALTELRGNLSILQANLSGVSAQLEDQQRRAGIMERNGTEVSEAVQTNIHQLEAELVEIRKQIRAREQEIDQRAARYDRDIERFREIKS
ncbi:hypothetical protein [Gilvimarinus algae]|uniref:DUF4124 domain-containing protein n=1 Tax=Gilvimarinus algae TaxID=3058037 RepID=A0ABT8TB60_9GAMM|nr:hypothetical protein [Gilvimarinus sp. SDUM040014]MDO3381344.1 hypothetical protein [Gilvimarinus sp. SDUM040014]